jgi:hypothetical protein
MFLRRRMIPRKRKRSRPGNPAGENGALALAAKRSRQPSARQTPGEAAMTLQEKPKDRSADPLQFRLDEAPFNNLKDWIQF